MSARPLGSPDFDVVMLGGDIGVYALARAFHEAYGVRSTVISRIKTGPVDSEIIDHIALGADASVEDHLSELIRFGAARTAERPAILLANTDGYARLFTRNREALEQHYVMALLDEATLDRVSDKGRFAQVCTDLGITTPATLIQDFAAAGEPGWAPDPVDLPFPVVAKAAASREYEAVSFEGKRKVFFVDSQAELDEIFAKLAAAGFRDRFVIQELIPGDDTWMRSVTAYRDQFGEVTLMCTAQVLLEDHTPTALGNPVAMITTPFPEAMDQARRLLDHLDYRGFANFDVKVDPRDGSFRFLEVNPRIGRNNYYVTAAGANVARFIVGDVVEGRRVEPVTVRTQIVYSVLPKPLLLRYVTDPALKSQVREVAKRNYINPLAYSAEGRRRQAYVITSKLNHVKKFAQHYPRPTETGF